MKSRISTEVGRAASCWGLSVLAGATHWLLPLHCVGDACYLVVQWTWRGAAGLQHLPLALRRLGL
ncbi:hypothetical protein PF005_g24743 [Phytophthora fragariae]|uniref:Uncharacterized protein n=1 Tax=Phytophthora fragariae TaxID=53985 RepID=A0A6A3WPY9_9STRA|nr:hypothetical protein PF009_g25506 [Phytophthora fragariae]KAE8977865.1 hypothetical protein PF011_g23480 [Phytophthora fragariae]KAE9076008.1 hypothetical protein PF010_g24076 [Phytophthora fragariae]KAE9076154.1 hypothetical protein PF007_g24735 [Phytophthora fragariae]KAE9095861.1 hypothetical protein PF006_g23911 [Phytophthora fragariae]